MYLLPKKQSSKGIPLYSFLLKYLHSPCVFLNFKPLKFYACDITIDLWIMTWFFLPSFFYVSRKALFAQYLMKFTRTSFWSLQRHLTGNSFHWWPNLYLESAHWDDVHFSSICYGFVILSLLDSIHLLCICILFFFTSTCKYR